MRSDETTLKPRRWTRVLFLAAGAAAAQQPPPTPTFRAGTELVQVNVVAQDQNGKPVAGLRREEFRLFDNGVPQEFPLFVAETGTGSPPPAVRAPNTFTNRIEAAAGERSGYSVIVLDNLVSGFGDPITGEEGTGFGVGKVLRTLRTMPPGEKIAVYTFGRRLQIVSEFTSDRDFLERRLRTWKPSIDDAQIGPDLCGGGDPSDPANSSRLLALAAPGAIALIVRARAGCMAVDLRLRVSSMDGELQQIADHLSGIPGRKKLIWMANRFPIAGGPGVLKLANAGVAIYPVDENGVFAPSPDQVQMKALAALTGGVAFFLRNDLDNAIEEAVEDDRVSYTLGFYPPQDKRPSIHQLVVLVSRPGVTLRYRALYRSEKPRPVSASPVDELVKAMNRPIDATAIPVSASATRSGDRLTVSASVDLPSLDLHLDQGLWKGKAELIARFVTAEGVAAGEVMARTVSFNLRPATYARMLQTGFSCRGEWKVPPKAVELKLLFANLASGKVGTLSIPLSDIETATAGATHPR